MESNLEYLLLKFQDYFDDLIMSLDPKDVELEIINWLIEEMLNKKDIDVKNLIEDFYFLGQITQKYYGKYLRY
jgi:hypothetical protein